MLYGDFRDKWGEAGTAFDLNEEQGAQSHFNDLCHLLGVPTPGSLPPERGVYRFGLRDRVDWRAATAH